MKRYAIIHLDKYLSRENGIGSLLDDNNNEKSINGINLWTKDFIQIVSRNTLYGYNVSSPEKKIYEVSRLQNGATYKTLNGVEKFYEELKKNFNKESFYLVDCTEKWNKEILNDIENEKIRHKNKIEKLNKLIC
jgi:hypothetical protein